MKARFQSSGLSRPGEACRHLLLVLPRRALAGLIHLYQWTLGLWLGGNCRFYPSCSNYALEALAQHGCRRGTWLSFKRICKCHPLNRGGVDLVPAVASARNENLSWR
jgi:putative membrane protein insertion efficiency factor